MSEDEMDLGRLDDDGWGSAIGSAITSSPAERLLPAPQRFCAPFTSNVYFHPVLPAGPVSRDIPWVPWPGR